MLAERILAGDAVAIARGISVCEAGGEAADALLAALPPRRAHTVGVTGSAGAGKSTLVGRLARAFRDDGATVAVVAVDPSSPLTGGALLGDRIRLDSGSPGAHDRGLFFRSLASRGAAGGLSNAARAATQVLSAGGFDVVLVETVGAGQAEVEIMDVADTVLLVLQPGAGDDVQALKAGLLEIADVYVLNKADQAGADSLRREVVESLGLAPSENAWSRPVIETVAVDGTGIGELVAAIEGHRLARVSHGDGAAVELSGARLSIDVARQARSRLLDALAAEQGAVLARLDRAVLSPAEALDELVRRTAQRLSGR